MKYLAWLTGIIIIILVLIYVVLFTGFGNEKLKPIIEEKIKEQTKLDSKLSSFRLTMSSLDVVLELDRDNIVTIKGDYSLFASSFDLAYKVELNKMESLKALTNAPVEGKLNTNGTLKGDKKFMEINGVSDIASSETTYHVELQDFNPTSIIAKVKEANLASLLKLGGQKAYASANLNLDINFKNITPHALDGDIALNTQGGVLNSELMKKDFEINIPQTAFDTNLDAKLKGDDVDYKFIVNSNLAQITSSGKVIPEPLKTDIKYDVDVKELAVLQPITGADIRGSLKLNGTLQGTKEKLILNGVSDFASSDTTFEAILKEFKPASIKASMKNLELAKVLYMVKQPHYADGIFSLNVDISDAASGSLKGNIVSNIKDGVLDSDYLTKAYEFKTLMPRTTFKLDTNTVLNGNFVDTKIDLASTLANFNIQKASMNLKDGSLVSDYAAKIPNLDSLYFASERHLKGNLSVNGELKKGENLDLTIFSKVAGGDVRAKLHNDDFHADLTSLQTLDILKMLIYPEVFKSSLNGVVDYNIAQSTGTFKGDLLDGKFTDNQVLSLVKQFAKVDLYKENFKGDVTANINKEHIVASLNLASINSSIKTKDTKLNSQTKQIDSKIDIVANNNPLSIILTGDASAPKVTVDAKELIKSEGEKVIKKELGNLLKGLF
jgi:hypothetical protein